ncbi:MAG: hypothetical protein JWO57_3829 [Pseudonocardiales bacterium]|nr:hypothetical protein [Pseudonocardiales bacterium]
MPSVLLATCSDLPSGDEDGDALVAALAASGVQARWRAWNDPAVDWSGELVVVRSTWDYTGDRAAFVAWARSVPRLANPADVIAWNSDKTYLRELVDAGVPVVPTRWAAPGEPVELPIAGEFVVKPSVGAGSKGAGRFTVDAAAAAREHAARLHDAGRVVLVQPYLGDIDRKGETALIYVDGEFSHAISKGAMLASATVNPLDPGFSASLFVEERIAARTASDAELTVGSMAIKAVRARFDDDPLYARVDLLPTPDGPVVVELELTEPSLFLGYVDGAAERFAAAIAART